jgi:gliding motility-associated-like protein
LKLFLAVILFMFCCIASDVCRATHIVGGEMNYSYLGNNVYLIELTVFRDCGPSNTLGTGFDEEAAVGFYDLGNLGLETVIYLPLTDAEVEYVPVFLENPCYILPPDVCVERAIYSGVVELPFNTNGYQAVYQRCCRNPSIVNLDFPNGNGTSVYTSIPGSGAVDQQNNDAYFNNYPPVALCRDAEFFFDHSATDEDGDSLVYTLCPPMHGASQDDPAPAVPDAPPFTEVSWAAGYSWDYPIDANPAFAIDPYTGSMTGTAIQNGQYVLGVCVNEYRDGVLINSSIRDFQFNVTTCDPTIIASTMDPQTACVQEVIQFTNNSTNATTFNWDFGVANATDDTSSDVEPTYQYQSSGDFTVTLIANPGWFCADTAYTTVSIPSAIAPQIIVGTYECVDGLDVYQFGSSANAGNAASYSWDFGAGSIPQFSSAAQPGQVQLNPEVAQSNIVLQVTDQGCIESDNETIENPPNPVASIGPQSSFCDGYDYVFTNNSINATDYYWNFGTIGTGDVSILPNPTFTFPDTGMFVVNLMTTAPFTCPDSASTTIFIYGLLDPVMNDFESQCLLGNSFDFLGGGASTGEAIYNWTFENGTPSNSTSVAPQNITFDQSGWHEVVLTVSENGCIETRSDSVWVVAEFENQLLFDPVEGCPGASVNLQIISESEVPVYYVWDLGDQVISYAPALTHQYMMPGAFDIQVEAYTLFGCIQSETLTLPNAVTIHPAATASFMANPSVVSILDPIIAIQSTSPDATACIYVISDGGSLEDCDGYYAFNEAGLHTITQYVTNEWGCGTSVSGTVMVQGFLFFAPNAFTPDNDGINDVWLPEMTGVEKYELKIFDRWGELFYVNEDPSLPWTGKNKNNSDHYAPNGIYLYRAAVTDLTGTIHEFKGTVSLIR